MNSREVSHADVLKGILAAYQGLGHAPMKVYPIPRGGVPVAYLLKTVIASIEIVSTPEEAELFVDDIIDSGETVKRYTKAYPGRPFIAAFAKSDCWLVFPWEKSMQASGEDICTRLLEYIGEDPKRGGLVETPARYAKAWKEWTAGYAQKPSDVLKVFEDGAKEYDQMVIVQDIPVFSNCEHHLAPFFGVAHIGYIPNGKICGLSKLARLVDIFSRRLQVQERLTQQIANALDENLKPLGVGVIIKCRHMCMESRGACKSGAVTTTSAMKGHLLNEAEARAEFLKLIEK